MAGKV